MTIADYINFFHCNSHIAIGDGLFYAHFEKKSEVVSCNNITLMTLSANEYCIHHKNKIFTIYNEVTDQIYFLNMYKEQVASLQIEKGYGFIKDYVCILEDYNLLAFIDYKNDCICFIDYEGHVLNKLFLPTVKYIKKIHQISESLIVIDFFIYDDGNPESISNKFYKSEVYNISTGSCVLKKEDSDNSGSIITNVSLFLLPCEIPNLMAPLREKDKTNISNVPVIKYSVVEPIYSSREHIEFQSVTKFCDFLGIHIKDTPYSEISPCGKFYLTSRYFASLAEPLYGLLDKNFKEILPCLFKELSIEDNKIFIPQPNWGDTLSETLDLKTKCFELMFKSGEKIILPPGYSGASLNTFKGCPRLLQGYKYSNSGVNLCGIIDIGGEEILPALYASIQNIHDNLYVAYLQETDNYKEPTQQVLYIANNKVNICNKYVRVEWQDYYVETPNYARTRLYEFNDKTNVKFGLIDSYGNEILPPCYDYISFPKEGKACYIKNDKVGWYDVMNDCWHEFNRYSFIKSFTKNCAIVCTGTVRIRTISSSWEEIGGPLSYGEIFHDDIRGELKVYLQKNHQEGIIDNFGKVMIEPRFQKIIRLNDSENNLVVKFQDKYGCINIKGEIIIPIIYEWFYDKIYDLEDKNDELTRVTFLLGNATEVFGYNSNIEMILNMSRRLFENTFIPNNHDCNKENYDYDCDTYYALGGDDYDEWRNNGGNIDDMMDSLGL